MSKIVSIIFTIAHYKYSICLLNIIIALEIARNLVLSDDTIRTRNSAHSLLRPQLPCVISDPLEYHSNQVGDLFNYTICFIVLFQHCPIQANFTFGQGHDKTIFRKHKTIGGLGLHNFTHFA